MSQQARNTLRRYAASKRLGNGDEERGGFVDGYERILDVWDGWNENKERGGITTSGYHLRCAIRWEGKKDRMRS